MTSKAQLDMLVTIKVVGAARHGGGRTETGGIASRTLRAPVLDALHRDGLVRFGEPATAFSVAEPVLLTDLGEAVIAIHDEYYRTAEITYQVAAAHRFTYRSYSRGANRVPSLGRLPRGCEVVCSCGHLRHRDPSGQKAAERVALEHLGRMTGEALIAAGIEIVIV